MNKSLAEKILGINSTASSDDIKKAYRKKAMELHPDRPNGSESKFKELQEAFEYLIQPPKKSKFVFSDDWAEIFRNATKAKYDNEWNYTGWDDRKSNNYVANINMTLEEAFNGFKKTISLKTASGNIKNIDVTVLAGTRYNSIISHENIEGDIYELRAAVLRTGPNGEIYDFDINDTGDYYISGDITSELLVHPFMLITGGWKNVKMIDGSVISVRIPAGQEANKKLKIKGKGYWKSVARTSFNPNRPPRDNGRGDYFLKIIPEIQALPEINSETLRNFMNICKLELELREEKNAKQI